MSTEKQRPAQLQVNTAGAWKTVVSFDAGSDLAAAQVQEAAQVLHQVDPAPYWRITTAERHPVVLLHMGRSTHGLWIKKESE